MKQFDLETAAVTTEHTEVHGFRLRDRVDCSRPVDNARRSGGG